MIAAVEVKDVLFCAYAADDERGHTTLAGIHAGLSVYQRPADFPQYIAVVVRPKVRKGDFVLGLRGPGGMVRAGFGFEANEEPGPLDRLVFSLPFSRFGNAEGRYALLSGDTREDLKEEAIFDLVLAESKGTKPAGTPVTNDSQPATRRASARKKGEDASSPDKTADD